MFTLGRWALGAGRGLLQPTILSFSVLSFYGLLGGSCDVFHFLSFDLLIHIELASYFRPFISYDCNIEFYFFLAKDLFTLSLLLHLGPSVLRLLRNGTADGLL